MTIESKPIFVQLRRRIELDDGTVLRADVRYRAVGFKTVDGVRAVKVQSPQGASHWLYGGDVRPSRDGRSVGGAGALDAAVGLGILIKGLVVMVLVGLGALYFVWGGTNSAHAHCLAHRYGDNSALSTVACVVAH